MPFFPLTPQPTGLDGVGPTPVQTVVQNPDGSTSVVNVPAQTPPDPRIRSGPPSIGRISRGFMQRSSGTGGSSGHSLSFLWNPSQVQVSYGSNDQILPPSQLPSDAISGNIPSINTTISLNFQLWFDRTYEVNDGTIGVMEDVAILEAMVGVTDASPYMIRYAIDFFFGGTVGHALRFTGWITSMAVTYTHFANDMTPIRCLVDITANRISASDAAAGGALVHPWDAQYNDLKSGDSKDKSILAATQPTDSTNTPAPTGGETPTGVIKMPSANFASD